MVERIILRKNSEELVLDTVLTPHYILKSIDWGTIKGTHHTYKYVSQIGESITNTSLGSRPITIEGWIVALNESHMTTLKNKLNSFISPQATIDLLYSTYIIQFVPDETVKYSIDKSENNEIFCKFKINGTAPNPLFSDISQSYIPFVETEPTFHFPLTISNSLPDKGIVFGKRKASAFVTVTNNGSIEVGMKIVFKANGTVKNPGLINVLTNEKFTINKTLIANEEIEINTNIGEKGIRGRFGEGSYTNYYPYKDIDSVWLQLSVGNNLFKYEATEGASNLDVFIYFYNRYLEVQECY